MDGFVQRPLVCGRVCACRVVAWAHPCALRRSLRYTGVHQVGCVGWSIYLCTCAHEPMLVAGMCVQMGRAMSPAGTHCSLH